jgi:uncharacterized membrane protein YebE (DUF533 family)
MSTLRQFGGMSGFPRRDESEYDTFGTAHSSTSISAALGMAIGAQLRGEARKAVAIIGDGAMTAGMAFEALNNAGVPQVPPAVNAPPPAGSAPTTNADASAPPAVLEEAAKQAQDAVNEAVGAKPGSALPMIAAVGVAGLIAYALFARKG